MNKLYIAHGKDAAKLTRQLLEAMQPCANWDKNASIGIKPNLVVAKGWKSGATTNPAVCEAVIKYLRANGFANVFVIESAWLAADTVRAFKVCGYNELAEKYGLELFDVKKDDNVSCEYGGMKIDVSKRALETDYIINLPLIKGHCQTSVTCALKNMKGLIPDSEKRRFHAEGLSKPIAYLNKMIYPALTIADGTWADPSFEEGGNPVAMDTMVAGTDSVLIDAYAAKMLGVAPHQIGYLRIAEEIGVGSSDLEGAEMVEIGDREKMAKPKKSGAKKRAKARIKEKNACSNCYANLVRALIEMEDELPDDFKISIGQGFKNKKGKIGCGKCTQDFKQYVKGCPPDVGDIKKKLRKVIAQS